MGRSLQPTNLCRRSLRSATKQKPRSARPRTASIHGPSSQHTGVCVNRRKLQPSSTPKLEHGTTKSKERSPVASRIRRGNHRLRKPRSSGMTFGKLCRKSWKNKYAFRGPHCSVRLNKFREHPTPGSSRNSGWRSPYIHRGRDGIPICGVSS